LRSQKLKSNPHLKHDIGRQLSALSGVRGVETNPETGSVILHHDPYALRSTEVLAGVVETLGLAALAPEELPELLEALGEETELIHATGDVLSASMEHLAERFDAKTLVPAMLCLLRLRSLLVAEVVCPPKWYEYFWYAFGTYVALAFRCPTVPAESTRNPHDSCSSVNR
jgi:hypothetical protein